ncbi:hypothetical protein LOTGIDRAFT_236842 [Lottia gigantea]|uniref:CARMIL C-terminal domain-containing protein n=1 Tax=Lottia gigantea TaxID=225164 RepID=V3YY61_LOTGI|nr:hypothetical protein LOTGIDRAFT_236842 [Lottia gigantea]ESO83063.1 hypothetical protein LOTGIDRAFT_236842 [Lottia gigantea]
MCEIEVDKKAEESEIPSQIQEVDEVDLSFEKLDSLDESTEKIKSLDSSPSINNLDDGQDEPKNPVPLQHIVKSRPKRAKTRAPTRPVAPTTIHIDEPSDDGIGAFYVQPTVSTEPISNSTSSPSRKLSDSSKSSNQLKPEGKSEKKKGWSPRNLIKDKDKDKDKDKEKEKKSGGIAHGLSTFFGRKSGGKGNVPAKGKKEHEAKSEPKPEPEAPVVEEKKAEDVKVERSDVKAPIAGGESFEEDKKDREKEKEEETAEEKSESNDNVGRLAGGKPRPGFGGLGGNMLLEMKQKQEKRLSQVHKPRTTPEKESHEANNNHVDNKSKTPEKTETSVLKSTPDLHPPSTSQRETSPKHVLRPPTENKKPLSIPVQPVPTDKSPRPAPRVLLPPKKQPTPPADKEATVQLDSKPTPLNKPKPPPPTKPRPPLLAPKPRTSIRASKDVTDSFEPPSTEEVKLREKKPDAEVVTDSATLRLSVKEKIQRLSRGPSDDSPSKSESDIKSDESENISSSTSHESINGEKSTPKSTEESPEESKTPSKSSEETSASSDDKENSKDSSNLPKRSSRAEDEIMV